MGMARGPCTSQMCAEQEITSKENCTALYGTSILDAYKANVLPWGVSL